MKTKSILKKTSFLAILLVGILTGFISYASVNTILNQSNAKYHDYPENKYGETYGSALDAAAEEKEPDLIKAIGEDGTIGYVRGVDLLGELPKSPKEALNQQIKASSVREIPLYDVDGKTIKGKFNINPGKEVKN